MVIPAYIGPVVFLLVFVVVCAVIWGILKMCEVTLHPKLEKIAGVLILLICAVVLIFWVIGLVGGITYK